jgi:hypothetical protein
MIPKSVHHRKWPASLTKARPGKPQDGAAQEVPAGPIFHRQRRNLAGTQAQGHVEPRKAKSKSVGRKTWPAGHPYARPDHSTPDRTETWRLRQGKDTWRFLDSAFSRWALQSARPGLHVAGWLSLEAKPPLLCCLCLAIKGGSPPRLQHTLHFDVWLVVLFLL